MYVLAQNLIFSEIGHTTFQTLIVLQVCSLPLQIIINSFSKVEEPDAVRNFNLMMQKMFAK